MSHVALASVEEGQRWYAVRCRASREHAAAELLQKRFLHQVYLPRIINSKNSRLRALFPGYLFLCVDLSETPITDINCTPYVLQIVSFGGVAQSIPDNVISVLQKQVQQWNDIAAASWNFQPGESVRLHKGALKGLDAVFVESMSGADRSRILISFLGGLREVEVPTQALEREVGASATFVPTLLPRRTRGRGRRIT